MNDSGSRTSDNPKPDRYTIRLKGHLDRRWADWFDGLTLTLEDDGATVLAGPLADQAALHGVFFKIRDLGLTILSVQLDDTKD